MIYAIGSKAVNVTFEDFESAEADECNFVWSYRAELEDEEELPDELITFDANSRTFKIEAELEDTQE